MLFYPNFTLRWETWMNLPMPWQLVLQTRKCQIGFLKFFITYLVFSILSLYSLESLHYPLVWMISQVLARIRRRGEEEETGTLLNL